MQHTRKISPTIKLNLLTVKKDNFKKKKLLFILSSDYRIPAQKEPFDMYLLPRSIRIRVIVSKSYLHDLNIHEHVGGGSGGACMSLSSSHY